MIDLVRIFHALSNSIRVDILLIISNKNLTAGEIASHFKLEKATISYHLSLLKMSKLITSSRHKNYIYYSINRDTFVGVIGWLDKFRI